MTEWLSKLDTSLMLAHGAGRCFKKKRPNWPLMLCGWSVAAHFLSPRLVHQVLNPSRVPARPGESD